jgi:pantetheine-phosphate adenylyltransferase
MPGFRWIYISSSIVKEAARYGGDVEELVPVHVYQALQQKFSKESRES